MKCVERKRACLLATADPVTTDGNIEIPVGVSLSDSEIYIRNAKCYIYNNNSFRCMFKRVLSFSGVVSMVTSLRVDKLYDRRIKWRDTLTDPDSEEYQQLSYEASQAVSILTFIILCYYLIYISPLYMVMRNGD